MLQVARHQQDAGEYGETSSAVPPTAARATMKALRGLAWSDPADQEPHRSSERKANKEPHNVQ